MIKSNSYTCIFGGGAVRGMAHIGAIRAIEENDIHPQNIIGSSVGAIVAALYAVGYNYDEINEIFLNVKFDLFRDLHFGFKKNFAISKGEVFTEWVRELIEKKFYGENYQKNENKPVTFADLKKNLIITTTDLSNFKYQEFSKNVTPDFEVAVAVRISSSMPGLMLPYDYNGARLVDGDLLKSCPLWDLSKTISHENERILEFRLEGNYETEPKTLLDFVNEVYSCLTSVNTDKTINDYKDCDKIDIVKLHTGDVLIVDFNINKEQREKLVNAGYEQTKKYFSETLVSKKENLIVKYDYLLKLLNKLSDSVQKNNIVNSKIILGDIFDFFCDFKEVCDVGYYKDVKAYKTELLNSVRCNFWGKKQFDDRAELCRKLDKITDDLKRHINEMKTYLKGIKKG
ncbi:patatin-like phospholipase family protein [bacterium]|nr:patatin-like phospholipase family protein [bacterium]